MACQAFQSYFFGVELCALTMKLIDRIDADINNHGGLPLP